MFFSRKKIYNYDEKIFNPAISERARARAGNFGWKLSPSVGKVYKIDVSNERGDYLGSIGKTKEADYNYWQTVRGDDFARKKRREHLKKNMQKDKVYKVDDKFYPTESFLTDLILWG